MIGCLEIHGPRLPTTESEKLDVLIQSANSRQVGLPIKSLAFGVIVAVSSAGLLLPAAPTPQGFGIGLLFAACLAVTFLGLFHGRTDHLGDEHSRTVALPAPSVSWRAVAVLTMLLLIPSERFKMIDLPLTGIVGILKAVSWVTIVEMVFRIPLRLCSGDFR